MQFASLTLLLLSVTLAAASSPSWEKYKAVHGLNFVGAEDSQRRVIFEYNMAKVNSLNNADDSAIYGASPLAHLSEDEFRSQKLGFRMNANADLKCGQTTLSAEEVAAAPDSFDWRTKGAVTPVKNQGGCGSCWAFSTTGDVEGTHFLKTGQLVSLSEQDLVDCDKTDGGCNGGLMWNAFESIINAGGIETEADYPYKGMDGTCAFDKSKVAVKISNYTCLPQDEAQIAAYLATNGPLAIALNAGPLQFYMGGIINVWDILCNPKGLDHGVLLVGYGQENSRSFWIVKNSWGASWGEQGYFRIARGKNKCGLASVVSHSIA